jgi:chemotaxis protein CheX
MQPSLTTPESLADQRIITQQVFETMVDMEAAPCEAHSPGAEMNAIASLLEYSEPCEGEMLIECSPNLAFHFTSRLMSIELPTELNPDVIDAMGELVNMIGGNLKALMPEETTISAPHVLTGKEIETLLALRQRISRVCFSVGHDHCCVSLLERS